MAMFDQIRIKKPLPDGSQSDEWFQTKSMERILVDYEVDEEGQLWELGVCEVPDPDGRQALSYTGGIHFYNTEKRYDSLFDTGKLLVIRVHEE